ncbi:pantoate--beta-alanine ligase [Candidatus Dependentiae bacterium]|nr:pantoate--beta-alanine ligase [Candidatus Dependentiae bacterium]
MKSIKTAKQMQILAKKLRLSGKTIGFVPTMGYLHDGHISLLKKSVSENDVTILSIFVNPAQFAPNEDFDSYPRDYKRDEKLAEEAGADYIFYPSSKEMYPVNYLSYVEVEKISKVLEGEFRPTHFRGVTTVVAKLINIVMPDVMYLGQKDAQQAVILLKMREDLNFFCKIKIMPVIRDKNGLALSSRNVKLSEEDYKLAIELNKTLKSGKQLFGCGKHVNVKSVILKLEKHIRKFKEIKLDYIACRNCKTFEEPVEINEKCYLLIAAKIGKVRLIDNMIVG